MRRLAVLVGIAAALSGMTAASASADGWACYYCGPAWFSVGEQHVSSYDGCNYFWYGNWMWKSDTALGTIAFIDSSGGWPASWTDYRINQVGYVEPINWIKKLLCKNSSSVGYSAECRGYVVNVNTGCV